jgi:N-acyl-D-aspartate/D-glutamate deacylase
MLAHPCSLVGLGDGGAHCGLICDATLPTYLLSHWSRDRSRGPRFPLEWMIHKLTAEPAALFGLGDRGLLQPGMRADVNVIDFEMLSLEPPRLAHDLPAKGRRLVQGARGYLATVVSGELTREKGVDTGARPGRIARPLAG